MLKAGPGPQGLLPALQEGEEAGEADQFDPLTDQRAALG